MEIKKFNNQLMKSNCYIIVDDVARHCIVVDPASEKSQQEITFISENSLILDYIILTHEHTDHTWGVNSLVDVFPAAKVIATQECKEELPKADQAYFSLYMDDPNYEYHVRRVDITTEELDLKLDWCGHRISFIHTPGHSIASMCFSIEDCLFTGDTIMNFKPFIKKKNGGSWEDYEKSINKISSSFSPNTKVFPGHGDFFLLKEWCFKGISK